MRRGLLLLAALGLCAPVGCQEDHGDAPEPGDGLPYAVEVLDYAPGPGAGYGQEAMPEVILGAPQGHGPLQGSLDVLSLGVGGGVTLGFGGCEVIDGPGPDLLVFENPFWAGGDPAQVFAELGEVSVSQDGVTWHSFPCDPASSGPWPGCAGWTPTESFDPASTPRLDQETCGGDAFDLAQLGLKSALYVRVRDLSGAGGAPSAGFDLDSVGLIHHSCR